MHKKHVTAILLITAAALLVYSNTFYATFHFDDVPSIVENPRIKDLKYLPEILSGSRGLAISTFSLNYAAGGLNVFGYHLVNILIHIINGILVYFLILLTLSIVDYNVTPSFSPSPQSPPVKGGESSLSNPLSLRYSRIAMYVALIFTVHPIQTQAVTYITQRMESLASLFYLLALLLFISGARAKSLFTGFLLYCGVLASYFLGFKSKEIAITLPAVIFLYDLYFTSSGNIKALLKRWPLYAALLFLLVHLSVKTGIPAGAVGAVTSTGFSDVTNATAGFAVKEITPGQYLLTQFNVIMTYLRLLIIPVEQNLDYDYAVSRSLFELRTLLSFIGIVSILSAGVYLFMRPVSRITRHGRIISFFIFWFFVILSPTSSFVPIQDVIFEHRVYLPSVGFIAIFVILLDEFVNRFKKVE